VETGEAVTGEPRSFKERHRELQYLVRALMLVNRHNLRFKQGDSQDELLLFAEASLALVSLERFVRIVVPNATERDTLHNLLQKAVSQRLLRLPYADEQAAITAIGRVRNTLLHGNYEQAASNLGLASSDEYFGQSFASDIHAVEQVLDNLMAQIDPETGLPRVVAD
jgi:hypothetical protein